MSHSRPDPSHRPSAALDPTGKPPGGQRCRSCGKPDGIVLRTLPDGRWFDPEDQTWRDGRGRKAAWPDVVEYAQVLDRRTGVRAVRLSGDPEGRRRLLCPRCQMQAESRRSAARSRIRALARRAIGDLFLGGYDNPGVVDRFLTLVRRRRT